MFEEILLDEYKNSQSSRSTEIKIIEKQIDEICNNQLMLTEKYGLDKIKEDVYNKLMDNYDVELVQLRASKVDLGDFQKDIDLFVSFGLNMFQNLNQLFLSADVDTKVKLLGSIFSDKLQFFENEFRTHKFNDAVSLLCKYNEGLVSLENKKGDFKVKVSHSVPEVEVHCV